MLRYYKGIKIQFNKNLYQSDKKLFLRLNISLSPAIQSPS